jgi:hypothetical protein
MVHSLVYPDRQGLASFSKVAPYGLLSRRTGNTDASGDGSASPKDFLHDS